MKNKITRWLGAFMFSSLLISCKTQDSAVLSELGQESGDDQPYKYDSTEQGNKSKLSFQEEDLDTPQPLSEEELAEMQKKVAQSSDDSPEDTEELVEDYVHSLPSGTPDHDIAQFPFVMNDRVQKWIDYFTKNDRDRFIRFMERGAKYRHTIEEILVREGLPKELYYLAFIESGFSNHAKSSASAVGVWQFIKGTATRYDLRVDGHVDERSDLLRSTYAAARYLRDLFRVYQDWNLAMASYNAGEGRILRGIMRSSHRDYWLLVDKKLLPPETSDYVPKILAAALIGQNLTRYDFPEFKNAEKWEVKAVRASARQSLATLAGQYGLSQSLLIAYNPHLRRGYVPGGRSHYNIWVPQAGTDGNIAEVLESEAIQSEKERPSTTTPSRQSPANSSNIHRVRKGENLALIAKRYNISLAALRAANRSRIHGSTIYPGTRLRVPNAGLVANRTKGKSQSSSKVIYHIVRRGENLTLIAKRYGVGVHAIRQHNASVVRKNHIIAGMRLKIVRSESGDIARES